jgi:RecA-family ATPase
MLVLDPLVEFHSCDENSNVEMAAVAGVLRQIAVEADVAVLMLHHDRKPDSASSQGFAGSQHAMRGASSLQGVTRAILTLYGMAEKDAAAWGVSEDQRHLYLRLDQAKNNLGLVGGEPIWFRRTSVALQDEIGGDVVGVLDPIEMSKVQKAETKRPYEDALLVALANVEGAGMLWTPWPVVEREVLQFDGRTERSWRRWLGEVAAGERSLEHVELRGLSTEMVEKQRILIRKKGSDFLD